MKIMKRLGIILVAVFLAIGLISAAVAERVYLTEGYTIPLGRIGGERPQPSDTVPDDIPIPADDPTDQTDTTTTDESIVPVEPMATENEKALDENVEGLVVVEGEEKETDLIITEQTEVRTNEAQDDAQSKSDMIVVRDIPDGMGNIIMEVSSDKPMKIIGIEDHWYKVEVDGTTGYVFGDDCGGNDEYTIDFSGISINFFSNRRSGMQNGETLILTCKVVGYTMEYPLSYEWFVDRHDGLGMQRVEGNAATYEIPVSKETLSYDWHVDVYAEIPD